MLIPYSELRYLIVDDFDSYRASLNEMILGIGANHVYLARDGKEAIRMCKATPYDVIFMDYNLGKGKNGQQILEELHASNLIKNRTVFIMTTAEVNTGMVLSALEHQPDVYLAKPFSFTELKNRLDTAYIRNKELEDILWALDASDYKKAITHCDEKIDKRNSTAFWCQKIKAELLYKTGQYEGALEIYQPPADDRQSSWALLGLGKTLTAMKKFSEANRYLSLLLEKTPLSLEAHDALADNLQKSGDIELAQQTLKSALSISGRSVPRHKTYADICIQNEDLESALDALRKAISLATNSIHYGADNGLRLARCLTLYASGVEQVVAKSLIKEALNTLAEVTKEFGEPEVQVKSKLAEACAHHVIKNSREVNAAIDIAATLHGALETDKPAEILLEFVDTYGQTDNDEKAQDVVSVLQERYSNDAIIVSALDVLLDKPVSKDAQQDIKGINKRGVSHYKKGRYDYAIEEFSIALARYPKHVGIQLNLMQALLAILAEDSNEKCLKKCHVVMKKLDRISEDDEQFTRYQSLKSKFEKLKDKLNADNDDSASG
ncbi:MAG: hypothetical protein COA99_08945 [Moraxellaceae bacterium]|nr:MAG: hypothetical protein COA99_08945 [Moraxellaceae bacterium]